MPKFLLVAGKHVQDGVVYNRGDTVESQSDLERLNHPGARKFQRVSDGQAVSQGVPLRTVRTAAPSLGGAGYGPQNPHGQVTSGFQKTTGTPEGPVVGRALDHTGRSEEAQSEQPLPVHQSSTSREAKAASQRQPDTYDSMTVEELRSHAAEEEVDLRGAQSKEDIVKVLRSSQQDQAARSQQARQGAQRQAPPKQEAAKQEAGKQSATPREQSK